MALLRGAPGCGAEAQRSACGGGDGGGFSGGKTWYHLVMTNIALENPLPIGSMYGIYTNIGGILMVNVTIYSMGYPLVNQHSY